jgi:leucyl/phenylalanyl-tRNA--protein transferase
MSSLVWLSPSDPPEGFPPTDRALDEPSGLLAAGGDLSPSRLLAAYRRGIFPWYAPGQPILWWSPDPRAVLFPQEFRCTRSLAKRLRNGGFECALNRNFDAVVEACAAPRPTNTGTWITVEMRLAYSELHRQGYAHSVETYRGSKLVGGLYGVRIGAVFFGESMFSLERDASKVALAHLVESCPASGIALIDCQVASRHLQSLGSRNLARSRFEALLREQIAPA